MPVENESQIKARITAIREETAPEGNTKKRVADTFENIYDTLASKVNTTPTPPPGVDWLQAPVVEISGNMLDVSQGKLRNQGAQVTVPGISLTEPAVPAGQLQPYTLYADYSVLPAEFKAISNPAVGEDNSYAYPPVPAGGLWVGYFIMRELGFTAEPANPVTSISLNGGTPQVPGPTGHLNLEFNDASKLNSGTLPDARLSSNIPRLDASNEFTKTQYVSDTNPQFAAFVSYLQGDNEESWLVRINGKQEWGEGGNSAMDTDLYRASAAKLETTGKLNAAGGLQENGVDLSAKYAPIGGGGSSYTDADAIKAPLLISGPHPGSITLGLSDMGKLVNMESASACTVTIPPDSSVAFPVGTQIPVDWGDAAGQPTIVAGSGVTVQSEGNKYKITAKFSGIIIHKIAANTWRIKGALSA